jgi:hypothetical protein
LKRWLTLSTDSSADFRKKKKRLNIKPSSNKFRPDARWVSGIEVGFEPLTKAAVSQLFEEKN